MGAVGVVDAPNAEDPNAEPAWAGRPKDDCPKPPDVLAEPNDPDVVRFAFVDPNAEVEA